jgi:Arc/MetJ-type ribon-helix-helix transcriptional regulator
MTDAKDMVRLNLDVSTELNQILEELVRKTGGSKSDVLRQAITLMQVMVIAKEQTEKLGISETANLIATQIITSPQLSFNQFVPPTPEDNKPRISNSQAQTDIELERKLRELKSKQELRKDWILFLARDIVVFSAVFIFIFTVSGYALFRMIMK